MATGRYKYVEELIVEALYRQAEKLVRSGEALPETKKMLETPLEQLMPEFRQALDEKYLPNSCIP